MLSLSLPLSPMMDCKHQISFDIYTPLPCTYRLAGCCALCSSMLASYWDRPWCWDVRWVLILCFCLWWSLPFEGSMGCPPCNHRIAACYVVMVPCSPFILNGWDLASLAPPGAMMAWPTIIHGGCMGWWLWIMTSRPLFIRFEACALFSLEI